MVNKKGILVLFSGPSGVGKDTVLDVVLKKDTGLQKSISLTTREKRESEVEGKDYYFISRSEFDNLVEEGQVLEFAQYGSNFYGTPKAPVDKWLSEGKIVILKIEVQGAAKIKELYPDSVAIFLLPPSMNELEKRLRSRGTENEEDLQKAIEVSQAKEFIYNQKEGLDTILTPKGTNISGGQKQRLYIARALANNPEILILDDSSSALDYKTDSLLRKQIKENYNCTTIIIAQRISSIKHCDYILVLDEGKEVGYGNHDHLMQTSTIYNEIYQSQMGGGINE